MHSKYNRHLALWAAAESAISSSRQPLLKKNKNLPTTLPSIMFVNSSLKLLTAGKKCKHHPVVQLSAFCGTGIFWARNGISVFSNHGCIFLLWICLIRIYMHHNISVHSKLSSLNMLMQEGLPFISQCNFMPPCSCRKVWIRNLLSPSLLYFFQDEAFSPKKKLKNLFRFLSRQDY